MIKLPYIIQDEMTSSYKFIDHTADIAFDVEAETLEELFTSAAEAWKESVLEKEVRLELTKQKKIELEAGSIEQLLVEFLSELNFLLFTKKWLYLSLKNLSVTNENTLWKFSASMNGNEISEQVLLKQEIKAITYHQMEIVNENSKYKTRVVFDI